MKIITGESSLTDEYKDLVRRMVAFMGYMVEMDKNNQALIVMLIKTEDQAESLMEWVNDNTFNKRWKMITEDEVMNVVSEIARMTDKGILN